MIERIRELCKKNGTSLAAVEKQLGFANGSLAKTDEKTQSVRIKALADYFGVSNDLRTFIVAYRLNSFKH